MAKQYRQRPSEIIGLVGDYESFCFDEACAYILSKLQDEDSPKPRFEDDGGTNKNNNDDVIEWLNTNNN